MWQCGASACHCRGRWIHVCDCRGGCVCNPRQSCSLVLVGAAVSQFVGTSLVTCHGLMEVVEMSAFSRLSPVLCPSVLIDFAVCKFRRQLVGPISYDSIFHVSQVCVLLPPDVLYRCQHVGGLEILPHLDVSMDQFRAIVVVELVAKADVTPDRVEKHLSGILGLATLEPRMEYRRKVDQDCSFP